MHITDDSDASMVAQGLSKTAYRDLMKMEADLATVRKRQDAQDRTLADILAGIERLEKIVATEKAAREWIAKLRGPQP